MEDLQYKRLKFVNRKGAEQYAKFRVAEWFDVDALQVKFGVEAQVENLIWCHLAHEGSPLIFGLKEDAQEEVNRLRKASKARAAA